MKQTDHRNDRNPYARFAGRELIMRDHLAIDRTVMANDRTFLAYCRTCLALALTGAGVIRFFDGRVAIIAGIALIALGAVTVIFGGWRTVEMSRRIRSAGSNAPRTGERASSDRGGDSRGQ